MKFNQLYKTYRVVHFSNATRIPFQVLATLLPVFRIENSNAIQNY